jgi:hypothetical protein
LRNGGTGTFTDSGQTVGTGGTFDVALGDLDVDGDLDAFFANGSGAGDASEAWENDGTGTYSLLFTAPHEEYSLAVELFDCDGDDDLDAFVGNQTGQPNRLYRNDGDGGLEDSVAGTYDGRAADLDQDGDLDLVLSNLENPEQVLLNDGACGFSSAQILGSSSAESVALGDVDGDGDQDAVLGTYGGILRLLRNDGAAGFVDADLWTNLGYGPSASAVRLADFDGDGDLDLWAGACCVGSGFTDDPPDRLFLNDGAGNFADSGQLLGSEYTTGLAVGDVDTDGDLDVVASHYPSFFSTGAR